MCDVARYMAGHWGNAHRTCCLQLTQYSVVLMRTMHGIQQTIRTLVSPLFFTSLFFLVALVKSHVRLGGSLDTEEIYGTD